MNGNSAVKKFACERERGKEWLEENIGSGGLVYFLCVVMFVCVLGWASLEQVELLMGKSQ